MNKNLLENYKNLPSEEITKSENEILEEKLNTPLSINDLIWILKQYLIKFSKLEIGFDKTNKWIKKNVSEVRQIKKELDWKINIINNLIFWILIVFFLATLSFIYDSIIRFSEEKYNYINQTKELEKQIELFKKEQENLKEENKSLKENLKNEIEKEIYKTILKKN